MSDKYFSEYGGPAFPIPASQNQVTGEFHHASYLGMSMRDWLIGMALCGIMQNGEPEDVKHNAIVAIRNADAVLAERDK